MDSRRLIDAIVRQTTILIAQVSTTAGVRSPLARVADQVFDFFFPSYARRTASVPEPIPTPYGRTPDLILGSPSAEQWIELKSSQFIQPSGAVNAPGVPGAKRLPTIGRSSLPSRGRSYHREFVGDRIGLHYTDATALRGVPLMNGVRRAHKVPWWFQAFSAVNGSRGATEEMVRELRQPFCVAPSVKGGATKRDRMLRGTFPGADTEDIRIGAFDWQDLAGELSDYLPELAQAAAELAP